MGQYWRFLNIDRCETVPAVYGKLGEFFWSVGHPIQERFALATRVTLKTLPMPPRQTDPHNGMIQ
jgi:hypothetical protein